jgi:hypothetical protein
LLVHDTQGGLTTAEVTNRTGDVLSNSRSDLAELVHHDEAQRTARQVRRRVGGHCDYR